MMSWTDLPVELRSHILELVRDGISAEDPATHLITGYVTVSREWQLFFEPVTFRTVELVYDGDDRLIHRFASILTETRRTLLRSLHLRIKLPAYDDKLAATPDDDSSHRENCRRFTRGLWQVLLVMEEWRGETVPPRRPVLSIEFRIGAFSPSDDRAHCAEGTVLDKNPAKRPFFRKLEIDWLNVSRGPSGAHILPRIPVVSHFSLPRCDRRIFSPRTISTIWSFFPRVTSLTLEPWREMHHRNATSNRPSDLQKSVETIVRLAHGRFKRISIRQSYYDVKFRKRSTYPGLYNEVDRKLALLPFESKLEELSICDAGNAVRFFSSFHPRSNPLICADLRRLAIGSPLLTPNGLYDDTKKLLREASCVVDKCMPALCMLEIFNADSSGVAIFRYHIEEGEARASWASSWNFEVPDAIKSQWDIVSRHRTNRPLVFAPEVLLDADGLATPENFIRAHLATHDLVLNTTPL